jgi:hypothetical protein
MTATPQPGRPHVVIVGAGFAGLLAWLLWLLVHIYWLVGFRNRLTVMLDWLWAYETRDRGSRVIINDVGQAPAAQRGGQQGGGDRLSDAA